MLLTLFIIVIMIASGRAEVKREDEDKHGNGGTWGEYEHMKIGWKRTWEYGDNGNMTTRRTMKNVPNMKNKELMRM